MTVDRKNNPPYLIGLLCLFPFVGFFVGVALILYGLFRYKDWKLTLIGVSGVLITVVVYGLLFHEMKNGKGAGVAFAAITQGKLNELVPAIEYYKLKEGQYPDSLEQLLKLEPQVMIADPLLVRKMDKDLKITFQYLRTGEQYTLFSVGIDGIAGTKDDIHPKLLPVAGPGPDSNSSKGKQ